MKIINVAQGTPEWLDWRKRVWTASECAALMERSPYQTRWQVFAEKVGIIPPRDLSNNPMVRRGKAEEDHVRRRFEDRHRTTLIAYCAEHGTVSYLGASFDGLTLDGNIPIELKVPHPTTYNDVLHNTKDSDAFKLYWCQVQAQIDVAGADHGWLVFSTPDVAQYEDLEFRIERDDAFIAEWHKVAAQMQDMRLKGREPAKDPQRDVFVPTGETAKQWDKIARQYAATQKAMADITVLLDAQKEELKTLEEEAIGLMDGFAVGEYHGLRIVTSIVAGRVDYKALLADKLPDFKDDDLDAYRAAPTGRRKVTIKAAEIPSQEDVASNTNTAPTAVEAPEQPKAEPTPAAPKARKKAGTKAKASVTPPLKAAAGAGGYNAWF